MPDIELLHLENGPARGAEPRQPDLIVALVENTPVEELTLHLDKNTQFSIGQVDPADPRVFVTDVDLSLQFGNAGPLQEFVHPALS